MAACRRGFEPHVLRGHLGLEGCVSFAGPEERPARDYGQVRDFSVSGPGMAPVEEDIRDDRWKDRRGLRLIYAGMTTSFSGRSALGGYLDRVRRDAAAPSAAAPRPATPALRVLDAVGGPPAEDHAENRRTVEAAAAALGPGQRAVLEVSIAYPGRAVGHAALLVLERLGGDSVAGLVDANATQFNRRTDAYLREELLPGSGFRYAGPLLPTDMDLDAPGEAAVHTGPVRALGWDRILGGPVTPLAEVRRRFPWWADSGEPGVVVWDKLTQARVADPEAPLGPRHLLACRHPRYEPFVVDNCRTYHVRRYGLQTDGSCAAWAGYAALLCLLNPATPCAALARYMVWASLGGRRGRSAAAAFAAACPLLGGHRYPPEVRLKSPLRTYDTSAARLVYGFLQYARAHCAEIAERDLSRRPADLRMCAAAAAVALEGSDAGDVRVLRGDWQASLRAWRIEGHRALGDLEVRNLAAAARAFDRDDPAVPPPVEILLTMATLECQRGCGRGRIDPREGYVLLGSGGARHVDCA